MIPALNLGPLVLPTAPLTFIIGFWLALSMSERAASRLDLDPDRIYSLAATSLLAGVVGARLMFVALYWPAYRDNLLGIVWPINTGFNVPAGVIAGLSAAFFYGRAQRLRPWPTLDALAPGLVVVLMAASLADFLGGPGIGEVTVVPWGITQFDVRRHPVQLYEIAAGSVALLIWWRLHSSRRHEGRAFLATIVVYAGGRLVTDAFRAGTWLTAGGYHVWQIVSLLLALAGITLLAYYGERSPAADRWPES